MEIKSQSETTIVIEKLEKTVKNLMQLHPNTKVDFKAAISELDKHVTNLMGKKTKPQCFVLWEKIE